MIHVTNRPNVHVRLAAIKLLFTHRLSSTYLLATFAMISSLSDLGTSSYAENCIV